jgi:hypothetical protein
MSGADALVDRAADWLEARAVEFRRADGWKARLADELAEDAGFLRKLKPSLMRARAQGRAPTDQKPGSSPPAAQPPQTPSSPQLGSPPPKRTSRGQQGGGPNPFLVAGAALAAGILVAKIVDWRGHAHPRS